MDWSCLVGEVARELFSFLSQVASRLSDRLKGP